MPREDHYKKISEETLGQNPWWKYQHETFKLPDGKTADYFFALTPGNAMIVPITTDGRLVLVSQYRYLAERMSIEFPCGGTKAGENPAATAMRELKEETGYTVTADDLRMVGNFEPDIGLVKDRTYVFLATDIDASIAPAPEEGEIVEVLLRRPDELEDMIRRGEIIDGQILAVWALTREFISQHHGVS